MIPLIPAMVIGFCFRIYFICTSSLYIYLWLRFQLTVYGRPGDHGQPVLKVVREGSRLEEGHASSRSMLLKATIVRAVVLEHKRVIHRIARLRKSHIHFLHITSQPRDTCTNVSKTSCMMSQRPFYDVAMNDVHMYMYDRMF